MIVYHTMYSWEISAYKKMADHLNLDIYVSHNHTHTCAHTHRAKCSETVIASWRCESAVLIPHPCTSIWKRFQTVHIAYAYSAITWVSVLNGPLKRGRAWMRSLFAVVKSVPVCSSCLLVFMWSVHKRSGCRPAGMQCNWVHSLVVDDGLYLAVFYITALHFK